MENRNKENKVENQKENNYQKSNPNQSASMKHRNAYTKSIPYKKKPYRENNESQNKNKEKNEYSSNNKYNSQNKNQNNTYNKSYNQNSNYKNNNYKNNNYKNNNYQDKIYQDKAANNIQDNKSEDDELQQNIKSALKQEDELAFDFNNNEEFIDINKSPIVKKIQHINPDDINKNKTEPNSVSKSTNNESETNSNEPPAASTQQNNENSSVEEKESPQLLFDVATQEQFIHIAKTYLMQLNDKGEMNIPMKSYPCLIFKKNCLIVPDIDGNCSGYGNKPIPFNQLKNILQKNNISILERLGEFNALKQDWGLYEDIGIRPLTDISMNGEYSDTAIIQIGILAASIHNIPLNNLDLLYKDLPINNTVEGFLFIYQKYLNGYSEGISKKTNNIYSLFRFPKDKSTWMSVPTKLPHSKEVCLCAINYSPNNIFLTTNGQALISDWSLAGFAPASYDLANIIHTLKLNKNQEDILIKTYRECSNLQNKSLRKEIEIFNSVFTVKDAIDLLAGSFHSVKQEILKTPDAEPTSEMLYEVIESAYKVWKFPEEKLLAKESMLAAINKWIRDKGPGRDEWIPETESLDTWLEQHMSIYRGDGFYL